MAEQNQQMPSPGAGSQFLKEPVQVSLPWRLMVFTSLLFIFSLLIYLGLSLGYKSYINSQIETLDQEVADLASEISAEEQNQLLGFYSQLANLQEVLGSHVFSQNIYSFLEENTLPLVFYTKAEYEKQSNSLVLDGRAASISTLVGQLTVFTDSSEVDRVLLESANLQDSGAGFGLRLFFDPSFFNRPT